MLIDDWRLKTNQLKHSAREVVIPRNRQMPSEKPMKQKVTILLVGLGCILAMAPLVHAQASKLNRSVRTADNFEPAIPRPEQDKAVAAKLAALEKKTGKKPNIVWLLVDDMG